jgi:dihydropteroate synthase
MISSLSIKGHNFIWGSKTYVMGILNITPDSFSGDGLLVSKVPGDKVQIDLESILEKARGFVENGADIIDVGGESTRPGADAVDENEEIQRIVPVIDKLVDNLNVVISIDTYKARVAEIAIDHGADMINDVWGFHADPNLAIIAAKHHTPVILMHNRSSWAHADIKERLGGRYVGIPYENLVDDVKRELLESVTIARSAGIPDENIILDPGIGFGKSVEQNLELVDRLEEIRALGFPLLLGPSRKSFIGYTLNLPPDERIEGTAAAVSVGIVRGADIVRVHDVAFMSRVIRMTDAIVRSRRSTHRGVT